MFSVFIPYNDLCRRKGRPEAGNMADLSSVKQRESLAHRREPHWQRLKPGCFLGYRPSAREGPGTWIARAYDDQARAYKLKALGDFANLVSREQFAAAKREAEDFAELVESGGHAVERPETVEAACRAYAKINIEAEGRFKRYVYSDPIAKVKLSKLRRHHLREWRQRLESRPALVSRSKAAPARTRERAPSSINRDMSMLRAALNKVLAPGAPDTDAAWQEALKPIKKAGRQRTLYLDRKQRRALLEHSPAEAAAFLKALCLLPLRPGAVAGLSAGDFDKRTRELTIGKDKAGRPRRIVLPVDAAELFTAQSKNKLPAAPLFARANGKRWDKESWKAPMRDAVSAAKLPDGATAYTLRHSTITDLVNAGLPLLTVAQISGSAITAT
jgi:site-specific recombinase XerD